MAALLAVAAPFSVPVGPVPISLATLFVCLAASLLGPYWGTASAALYLLLGAIGLPVFSGFAGGLQRLVGPTGGYLLGYLPLAFLTGLGAVKGRRSLHLLGMLAGTALLYGLGTAWYCLGAGVGAGAALSVCVLPFLPGDGAKLAAVLLLAPRLRRSLASAAGRP